jgi:hypothetical protein
MAIPIKKMDLQEWITENPIDSKMLWNSSAHNQLSFMRNIIAPMCNEDGSIQVIASHRSKSINLPVYEITVGTRVRFTVRDNFYNWKVSFEPLGGLNVDFKGLIDPNKEIHSCYCEGFPESRVFGSYGKTQIPGNRTEFTVELPNEYKVYVFFWLITRAMGIETGWD